MSSTGENPLKFRRALALTFILVLVSPVFGVILAEIVGYHEPLDEAAEMLGLKDWTDEINWTPLLDYTVPGLPDEVGYVVSGLIGIGLILGIGAVLSRVAKRR